MSLLLALRNVARQGRRSLLLGGAVGLGVLTICLAGALTTGFRAAALDNLSLGLGGHLRLSGYTPSATGRWQNRMAEPSLQRLALLSAIPGVDSVSFQASTPVTLVYGSNEVRLPLLGIEPQGEALFRRSLTLTGSWDSGDARSLVIDSATFDRLGAGIGDEVLVRLVTASGQQNLTEFRIRAVFDVALAGGRPGAIAPFSAVRTDLNLGPQEVPSIVMTLNDVSQAPKVAARLRAQTAGWAAKVEVVTVQETMGQLATILTTLTWLGTAVFLVMLALVAGGVTNTFRMVLLERVREIGTLRCLGMQKQGVLGLFLTEAALITSGGGLAGLILSLPLGALVGTIPPGWAGAAALVLERGRLPLAPDGPTMGTAWAVAAVIGVAAAWGPAQKASALEPAQALASLS